MEGNFQGKFLTIWDVNIVWKPGTDHLRGVMSFWAYCDVGCNLPVVWKQGASIPYVRWYCRHLKIILKILDEVCILSIYAKYFVECRFVSQKKYVQSAIFHQKFFKIYSSEYKQIVQIAIKTLRSSSGINNSIYFPLCAYLSKINFIAFTSN